MVIVELAAKWIWIAEQFNNKWFVVIDKVIKKEEWAFNEVDKLAKGMHYYLVRTGIGYLKVT